MDTSVKRTCLDQDQAKRAKEKGKSSGIHVGCLVVTFFFGEPRDCVPGRNGTVCKVGTVPIDRLLDDGLAYSTVWLFDFLMFGLICWFDLLV